jgi:hypothetical protein
VTVRRAAAICAVAWCAAWPAAYGYNLYPEGGWLGYAYNKWGSPTAGTPAVVTWSFMPVGTAGSAYCAPGCTNGTSTLTLPNFYDTTSHTFRSVNLTDADIRGDIEQALRAWGAVAGISFVYLASDSGVPVNDPAAEPPATGQIRIGVFDLGGSGPAGAGFAAPPNGFEPNSSQFATGAGDLLLNGNAGYAFQNPAGADGTPLDAYPQGGGYFLNDFTGLVLHEIGHTLGMDHSAVSTAVMCGYIYLGNVTCTYDNPATYVINRHPTADDIAGIQVLYGPPLDTDGDGVVDALDNCVNVANANQRDTNADGYGNLCDPDLNNDGTVNINDFNRLKSRLGITPVVDVDADLDGNAAININDLNRLKSYLGRPPGPSGLHPSCPPRCP